MRRVKLRGLGYVVSIKSKHVRYSYIWKTPQFPDVTNNEKVVTDSGGNE